MVAYDKATRQKTPTRRRPERPVVATEAQPVERVRLGTEIVREEGTVGGEVRREEIEVDDRAERGPAR